MDEKSRGNAFVTEGSLDAAEAAYTAGIDRVHREKDAATDADRSCLHLLYCNRSKIRLDLGRAQDALTDATLCIEAQPRFAKGFMRRAAARMALEEYDAAIEDLENAGRLDEGLEDAAKEQVALARRRRWKPNAALLRQRRLQEELKVAFVFFAGSSSDGGGGDTAHSQEEEEPLPAAFDTAAAKREVEARFAEAFATGDPAAVYALHDALRGSAYIAGPRKKDRRTVSKDAIKAQLQREFGFDPTRPAKSAANGPTAAAVAGRGGAIPKRPDAVVTARPTVLVYEDAHDDRREFFAGGPYWTEDPGAFLEALNLERPDMRMEPMLLEMALNSAASQRSADLAQLRLQSLYTGETDVPIPVCEHQRRYHRAGFVVSNQEPPGRMITQREIQEFRVRFFWDFNQLRDTSGDPPPPVLIRCEYCEAQLDMAWPPECICGMPYCSNACHRADVKLNNHRKVCREVLDNQEASATMTRLYWQLVAVGALRFPAMGETDFPLLWRILRAQFTPPSNTGDLPGALQKPSEAMLEALPKYEKMAPAEGELQFYLDFERPYLRDRVNALQRRRDNATEAKEAAEELYQEMRLQIYRATVPLHADSIARLTFKRLMTEMIYRRMLSVIGLALESRQVLDRKFKPFQAKALQRAGIKRPPEVQDMSDVRFD